MAGSNLKQEYQRYARETTNHSIDYALEYVERTCKKSPRLKTLCTELLYKKRDTLETRATLLRLSYEAAGGTDWIQQILPACAGVEILLASMYHANRILDDKGGVEILSDPLGQWIGALLLNSVGFQILHELGVSADIKVVLSKLLYQSSIVFFRGEYIDTKEMIWSPDFLQKNDFYAAVDRYYDRVYLINDSFYEKIAIAGALLGGASESFQKHLGEFGRYFGTILQLVNDVADFVPADFGFFTNEKIPEDSYADVKHKKLTLPILYTLYKGATEERSFLTSILEGNYDLQALRALTHVLIHNCSLEFMQREAKFFARVAKRTIQWIEKPHRSLLEEMLFIAYANRYYKALQQMEKEPQL